MATAAQVPTEKFMFVLVVVANRQTRSCCLSLNIIVVVTGSYKERGPCSLALLIVVDWWVYSWFH